MRLHILLYISTFLSTSVAAAIQRRDADFLSVRRKLLKDHSGRAGDPPEKYFHEAVFHPHYDGRFAGWKLGEEEQMDALKNLVQTYLATMSDLGVQTWLMHGTLLGWFWNKKILPWDSDIDVQVTEASMHYLAAYYNMSVFHYKTPRMQEARDYMLEINPHYNNRNKEDSENHIDARWIDTESGLFIDITAVRYDPKHPKGPNMLVCKDGHEYKDVDIFPLRKTFFEGTAARIPFNFRDLLAFEYGMNSMLSKEFEGHVFVDEEMEWIPKAKLEPPAPTTEEGVRALAEELSRKSKVEPPPPPTTDEEIKALAEELTRKSKLMPRKPGPSHEDPKKKRLRNMTWSRSSSRKYKAMKNSGVEKRSRATTQGGAADRIEASRTTTNKKRSES